MTNVLRANWLLIVTLLLGLGGCAASRLDSAANSLAQPRKPFVSWVEKRNQQVIMQEYDYSCGASALATILTYYYGMAVSEQQVIEAVGKDAWLSLADIQQVLPHYGFKGIGLALSYEELQKLKMPAILYLEGRGGKHFAVLRGIDDKVVWVADPNNGNVRYPVDRFRGRWEVRASHTLKGKVLLVVPDGDKKTKPFKTSFFHAYQDKATSTQ